MGQNPAPHADDDASDQLPPMTGVGGRMAAGAAWMIGLKLIERGIGVVSTLILARLLMPGDFGLIAMAMAVIAFVEVAGQFGFDLALIRLRDVGRAHYDSAWTLQVGYGFVAGAAIALLAWPTAAYFGEPRVAPVMWVLAAVAVIQGFENIGTVDFRKEFKYEKDFQFLLAKKLVSFVVTLALALTFRSYWALVAGMATSRVAGVVLSFFMHPYRPRFDTSQVRSLMGFSTWVLVLRLVDYLKNRGPDFLIGRHFGAGALGEFRVGLEIATLPTSELLFPLMRAVFPGYAAVAQDRQRLAQTFLAVQGTIVTLTLPAGIAIVLLADPIVYLLLGPRWAGAIPLVQVLGIFGALTVFQLTNVSIFHVLGVPQQAAWLKVAETLLTLSTIFVIVWKGLGLTWIPWAMVVVQLLMVPVGMHLIARLLNIGFAQRLRVTWRPLLTATVMGATIWLALQWLPGTGNTWRAGLQLALIVPVAGLVLLLGTWALWRAAGYPEGPEQQLVSLVRARLRKGPDRSVK